jgi:hypothetical protein
LIKSKIIKLMYSNFIFRFSLRFLCAICGKNIILQAGETATGKIRQKPALSFEQLTLFVPNKS